MPRKKKTSAEPELTETPAQEAVAHEGLVIEPDDDIPKPRRKAPVKAATKKPAAKKRASKATKKQAAAAAAEPEAAGADAGAAPGAPGSIEAEASAQAVDTFEDALEANDSHESRATKAGLKRGRKPVQEPDEADPPKGDSESGTGDEDEEPELPPGKQERLQKILAAAGVASRRHAEELITAGRVEVNGQVVTTLGSKADAARDHIRVDGKLLHGAERQRYFVLNKPRGYVTTVSDPEGRPTVMEFFAQMHERLYPVGRLDYLSEGLLLMTNDGELANQLTRAASGVEKVYLVKVAGQPDAAKIEALRAGVDIDRAGQGEGRVQTAPARIRLFRQGENPWFEVGLIEGRNRELRKMFEEIGHHVEKIRRIGYGPLELDVEPGKLRELTPQEVQSLRLAAEGKLKPKRQRSSAMLPGEAGRGAARGAAGKPGDRPAQRSEPRRGQDRGGQKWQDRGARGETRGREQRSFSDRGPRRAEGGGFAPRPADRPGFVAREGGAGERGAGRGFVPDRGQRGAARPRVDRPFNARPTTSDRPFRGRPVAGTERPRFEGRPPREGVEDRGSRPPRPAFRPEGGSGPKPGGFRPQGSEQRRGPGGGGGQRFGRPASGPRREGVADRGSRPPRPAFRPEGGSGPKPGGFRPQGSEQRRGPGGGGQRFGRPASGPRREGVADRGSRPPRPAFRPEGDAGPKPGGFRPQGSEQRRGPGSGGGQRFGRPASGPRREGNRGGFGRKSGPPKFGGGSRPGSNKGRRP